MYNLSNITEKNDYSKVRDWIKTRQEKNTGMLYVCLLWKYNVMLL